MPRSDLVSEGLPVDEKWMQAMIDASAPKLPESPSPAQLDAWIELAEIVGDASFRSGFGGPARRREMDASDDRRQRAEAPREPVARPARRVDRARRDRRRCLVPIWFRRACPSTRNGCKR